MKDVVGTLKRIDDEIIQRRQNIAYHQVEIARLEDTRKVLMSLAEDDQERAEQARNPERLSGPIEQTITVRKIGGGEEGPPPKANGGHAPVNKSGNKRGMNNPPGQKIAAKPKLTRRKDEDFPLEERLGHMKERVLTVLKSYGTPMDTNDIRKALGLQKEHHKSRKVKVLYNALYHLRTSGEVIRDEHDYTVRLAT